MGNTQVLILKACGLVGSPPYTWGTRFFDQLINVLSGITPIYMGNTMLSWTYNASSKDHPHIHGEHLPSYIVFRRSIGSPPYTWGTLKGSTANLLSRKDHPHIHGEHSTSFLKCLMLLGSPPYTWGTPSIIKLACSRPRITPIYMGNTQGSWDLDALAEDHPHIHGEHEYAPDSSFPSQGSPPYTWGTHTVESGMIPFKRITPIYMGNTLKDP